MTGPANYANLIPELKTWNNGNGIDIDGWIGCDGDYEHLIGYGRILWPEFVEHDDCVFFAEGFTKENYRGFMNSTNRDKSAVEAVMNHQHITDIFYNADPKPSREMVLYVGKLLKEVWQAKLNRDFPNRKITVSFPEDHEDDLLNYQVTFWQER